jgi:DNA-binding NarL/FixJ family response regulator
MGNLRIMIADDHEIVRRGLRAFLQTTDGWEVVTEAADGFEAVAMAQKHRPDLIIMDLCMPGLNGLDATRRIRESGIAVDILIITFYETADLANSALAAGACGYVLKSDGCQGIVSAIEALQRRRLFFTPKVSRTARLTSKVRDAKYFSRELSKREREVLALLATGKCNREVASNLSMSVKTVETHRAHIMHKLRLHSLGELVQYAIRNKLMPLGNSAADGG